MQNQLLSLDEDKDWLSAPLCLLRDQLEVFCATQEEVDTRTRARPHVVGCVGIRCRHCKNLPLKERANGSTCFPKSVSLVHQAVRNFHRYHFHDCKEIPERYKKRMKAFKPKEQQSKKSSSAYWIESCKAELGMLDAENGRGGYIVLDPSFAQGKDGTEMPPVPSAVVGNQETTQTMSDNPGLSIPVRDGNDRVGQFLSSEQFESSRWHLSRSHDIDLESLSTVDDLAYSEPYELSLASISVGQDASVGSDAARMASVEGSFHTFERTGKFSNPNEGPSSTSSDNESKSDHGANVTSASMLSTASSRNKNELLRRLRSFLDYVRACRERMHTHGKSSDMVPSDLVELGNMIERLVTDIEPSRPVVALHGERDVFRDEASEALAALKSYRLTSDDIDDNVQTKRRLIRTSSPARDWSRYPTLRESATTTQLYLLITSLLSAEESSHSAEAYKSFEEVEEDLVGMLRDPKRYLFDPPAHLQTGRIEFSKSELYGRREEQSQLAATFDRVIRNRGTREATFVSGASGTGKTTLVEHNLEIYLYPRGGRLISGKFDALGQRQPMAVVFQAFDAFCSSLADDMDSSAKNICSSISKAIGIEGREVLCSLMPNLRRLIGEYGGTIQGEKHFQHIDGKDGVPNQLLYFLRLFTMAISSPATPVVVFLDDLQWADRSTLKLVARILSDDNLKSFLLVGCYRDDEADLVLPIVQQKQELAQFGVFCSDILLGNITQRHCNEIISDLLHLPERVTNSLAGTVYTKTNGNPLFVKQFLLLVYEENFLWYSARSRRWNWDIEIIRGHDVADNVVGIITSKMCGLDPRAQALLKCFACLGSQCKASILNMIDIDTITGQMERDLFIQILVNDGLISKVGDTYRFSHDQIQKAAYDFIPAHERSNAHLQIGRDLLRKALSTDELKAIIFVIVDQFGRCVDLLTSQTERVEVAELCLMAGKEAMDKSAFVPASIYLLQGTSLLDGLNWEDYYELYLNLFTKAAHAVFVTGNHEGVKVACAPIVSNGRCIIDKFPALFTLCESSGAQGDVDESITFGLLALEELGEPIMKHATEADVLKEFFKTKALVHAKTWATKSISGKEIIEVLAEAPIMENEEKEAAIKMLLLLVRVAYGNSAILVAMLVLRGVQISLAHGMCRSSSCTYASYGGLLTKLGYIDEGYRYGKLALKLLRRFDANECLPQVYTVLYTTINVFVDPLPSILPELRYGHEVGLRKGNITWALSTAFTISVHSFNCGVNLKQAAEETKGYVQVMKEYNFTLVHQMLPFFQMMLNLIGDGEDSTELTGQAMNEAEVLRYTESKNMISATLTLQHVRLRLLYLFGDYDQAGELLKTILDIQKDPAIAQHHNVPPTDTFEVFNIGLIAAVMARRDRERSAWWAKIAEKAVIDLRHLSTHSEWNFAHCVALVDAEILYHIRGDFEQAARSYSEAVDLSKKHKFVNDYALSCERAAIFYSGVHKGGSTTERYYRLAYDGYVSWGASRKAQSIFKHTSPA